MKPYLNGTAGSTSGKGWPSWRPDYSRPCDLDREVSAVILRAGKDALPQGAVGFLRSLGRAAIGCYVASEELTDVEARSRYLRGHLALADGCSERPEELARVLLAAADRLPTRPVIVPNDDEAAVVLAEASESLASRYRLPPVASDLPRQLASKWALYQLCKEHGTPTLPSWQPRDADDLLEIAAGLGFPLVVKNAVPFIRLRDRPPAPTSIVQDHEELRRLIRHRPDMSDILVQAYIPDHHAEDWIVDGYCDTEGRPAALFTGRKLIAWPPGGGGTARGRVETNADLAALATDLCRKVNYRGIFDMDWRLDRRDGEYKLLDFNPRIGSLHRLFQDAGGVDVLRALHLDLSGRPVPGSAPCEGEELMVENLEVAAWLASRRASRAQRRLGSTVANRRRPRLRSATRGRLAWLALDDPIPFFAMVGEQIRRYGADPC